MKILNSIDNNYIISIDGAWGTGKTFFIKQLMYLDSNFDEVCSDNKSFTGNEQEIIKNFSSKYFTFYYNAWENDDHELPLESIIYNILDKYPKIKKDVSNSAELFNSIKPILMNIIDKSTFGLVTKECFENLNSFEELSKNIITLEEKKESLNKLFEKIIANDKRLLLIVDELDRCKPDFAVKMIETLKHFYDNPKITILIVTNNKQLTTTINHFYGNQFDGYGYLNKIYDTTITMKTENLENYIKHYLGIYNHTHLSENISYLLFKHLDFSYRECNKYMSMYKIAKKYIEYTDDFDRNAYLVASSIILPMSIALKIKDINDYEKFINGNGDQLIIAFIKSINYENESKGYIRWFKNLLKMQDNEDNIAEKLIQKYHIILNTKNSYEDFPYFEAISMLGNNISVD